MIKLSNEILESIDKQLTKEAAGRLAEFIKKANETEEELAKKDIALIEQINKNTKLNSVIEELQNLKLRKEDIEKGERNLIVENNKFNLSVQRFEVDKQLLNQKVELVLASKADIYNLVNVFVSNPRAIEFMSSYKNIQNASYYDGNRSQMHPTGETITGQIEKREQK